MTRIDRPTRRRHEQRARLRAAETDAFDHHGVSATSEPLELDELAITTRVVRVGTGPATVLLHGGALTATVLAPLLPHLPGRTLLLIDLPGCGMADAFDFRGVDLAAHQTAFVGAVLDVLELERAPLIGTSMGGWYALRFALAHPERVTGLGLVTAPAVALPGARMPAMMAATSTWLARQLGALGPAPSASSTRRMLATIGGEGSVVGVPDAMFDALGAAVALGGPSVATLDVCRWRTPHAHLQVTEQELASCEVPVLALWGEHDVVQSPRSGAVALAPLPHGTVEVLAGGHGLWFDQPERCGQLLSAFLKRTGERST